MILASASFERKRLLEQMGLSFEVIVSNYPEKIYERLAPQEIVRRLSYGKANAVAVQRPDAVVIGADTVIVCAHRVIGKPKDAADARDILRFLAGRRHYALTGLTIIDKKAGRQTTRTVKTTVWMKNYSLDEIDAYTATKEPFGKAGAYAILGSGHKLMEKIAGDPYNVAGLPVRLLMKLLPLYGIRIGQMNRFLTGNLVKLR